MKRKYKSKIEPLRIFVGTSANGEDAEACAVLESTLRASTEMPLDIRWMRLSKDKQSPYYSDPRTGEGWQTTRWTSPWTGLRWAVPDLCSYKGHAIYMDCAQVVMGDIAELVSSSLPNGAVVAMRKDGAALRTSIIVFDCSACKRSIPSVPELQANGTSYMEVGRDLLRRTNMIAPLPEGWGITDAEYSADAGQTVKSVHFENLHMQPHVVLAAARLRAAETVHWFTEGTRLPHYSNSLVELFSYELESAIEAGFALDKYIPVPAYGPYAIRGVDGEDLRVKAEAEG